MSGGGGFSLARTIIIVGGAPLGEIAHISPTPGIDGQLSKIWRWAHTSSRQIITDSCSADSLGQPRAHQVASILVYLIGIREMCVLSNSRA